MHLGWRYLAGLWKNCGTGDSVYPLLLWACTLKSHREDQFWLQGLARNSRYILSVSVQLFSDIFLHKNIGLITASMSQVFTSYRGGSFCQMISNKDTSYSASSHTNLRNCIINVVPTTYTLSGRASICLRILLWKQFILAHFRVIPSEQVRPLLEILEKRFIRIMTHMQILLNEGFCMPS